MTDQCVLVGRVEGASDFFFGQRNSDGGAGLKGLYALPGIFRLLRHPRCGSSQEQGEAKYIVDHSGTNVAAFPSNRASR